MMENTTKNIHHDVAAYEGKPLIPDGVMLYVNIYLNVVCPTLISSFGVVSNVINIIIFSTMGLKDGMSIGLWALAFSDFTVALQTLGSSLCFIVDIVWPNTLIDPVLVQYVSFLWGADVMYLISNWTTTFISLERCVCVMAPFKVKAIFTKNRSIFVICCIYIAHIASYVPIFATHYLGWEQVGTSMSQEYTGKVSSKVMVVKYTSTRAVIHSTVDIIHGACLPVIQQAIVIVSTACLVYGLKASSKIRQNNNEISIDDKGKKSETLSSKETRLVKVMIFLALILTICNVPRFIAVYCTLLIPEMHIGMLYENTYIFLWTLSSMFACINASVNIFVYLIVNVNYRSGFKKMFLPCSEETPPNKESSIHRTTSLHSKNKM